MGICSTWSGNNRDAIHSIAGECTTNVASSSRVCSVISSNQKSCRLKLVSEPLVKTFLVNLLFLKDIKGTVTLRYIFVWLKEVKCEYDESKNGGISI